MQYHLEAWSLDNLVKGIWLGNVADYNNVELIFSELWICITDPLRFLLRSYSRYDPVSLGDELL